MTAKLTLIPGGQSSHTDGRRALADPHAAMQEHRKCQVGDCITKSIAYMELARQGKLIPESGGS